jgi:hypothetical protein
VERGVSEGEKRDSDGEVRNGTVRTVCFFGSSVLR